MGEILDDMIEDEAGFLRLKGEEEEAGELEMEHLLSCGHFHEKKASLQDCPIEEE